MIALALAASLLVQLQSGQSQVYDGMSEAACREAKCAIERGLSCAEAKDEDARQEVERKKMESLWRSGGGIYGSIYAGPSSSISAYGGSAFIDPGKVSRIRCVP